ncbi:MAG: DNA repair protein RadC [Planctomycetota bacterium]
MGGPRQQSGRPETSAAIEGPRRYGPRERLFLLGEPRLSDAECIALILRTGRMGESVEQVAQRVLDRLGGLRALAAAQPGELLSVPAVGPVRAAALAAAFGLARRLTESRFAPGTAIRDAADVAALVRGATRGERRERFYALLLDARQRVLGLRMVSTGGLLAAPVHPREVFTAAIREGAAALVVAHNHPSGDPAPSHEDRAVTERLRRAGELVGVELLDHVVVGDERYYSFALDRTGAVTAAITPAELAPSATSCRSAHEITRGQV